MSEKEAGPLNFSNQRFVLEQLELYRKNSTALTPDWIAFFQGMEFSGNGASRDVHLNTSSCEIDHVDNKELKDYLQREMQTEGGPPDYPMIIREFWKARALEEFLQKKFIGAKRFSIEGGESFLPMLHALFQKAALSGYKTGVIGMAHRGRLNVLCNLLGKPYANLFQEFNTKLMPPMTGGLGDVKYHKGYNSTYQGMEMVLMPNPSHLESVDPVMTGFVRARKEKALPVTVHGDAAVAGQGVVYETLQLAKLKGYETFGTIHIVINNQVGFTAVPEETRSTRYCTDIAKAFGLPIFHVNADDPVACVRAALLAFEVRNRFASDVFIDLNCYRLYGHNEGDEPRFTNPLLYKKIEAQGDIYRKLVEQSGLSVEPMEKEFLDTLEKAFTETAPAPVAINLPPAESVVTKTAVEHLLDKITQVPEGFNLHPKLEKLFQQRKANPQVDWATAELLAYASLLEQKIPIRISGQDSKRGTFSHRHAVLFDQLSEKSHTPLEALGPFQIYNSPLSEYAVLGFEFGYTLGDPKALVIWEAQFGDFANGAQIITDQYIAGSETKWGVTSGLTLFLPHGHEGMGPEHTSCRVERFLELSAADNWRVIYPSTPAQLFHALRRQALTTHKRPLIVLTPKSMLRLSESFSDKRALSEGEWMPVIYDTIQNPKKTVLCTGKIYHELKAKRGEKPIAIVRVEELYPFPDMKLPGEVFWVQEEPENQGAWPHVKEVLSKKTTVRYIGRKRIPVPDTGSVARFHYEQDEILEEALKL